MNDSSILPDGDSSPTPAPSFVLSDPDLAFIPQSDSVSSGSKNQAASRKSKNRSGSDEQPTILFAAPLALKSQGNGKNDVHPSHRQSHDHTTRSLPPRVLRSTLTGYDDGSGNYDTSNTKDQSPLLGGTDFLPQRFPADAPDTVDSILIRLVTSEPFLSEGDLLYLLKRVHGFSISRRTLKRALFRNGLENAYKRYRAYISG